MFFFFVQLLFFLDVHSFSVYLDIKRFFLIEVFTLFIIKIIWQPLRLHIFVL